MKLITIILSTVLLMTIASPATASNWVEDFLRRYEPSSTPSPQLGSANLEQFLQTGVIPITMNDVINLMIEKNLDIRSNRLGPRSSYFQSLVFYRALQPSIRFAGTISRDNVL